jgi:hypothetical protein
MATLRISAAAAALAAMTASAAAQAPNLAGKTANMIIGFGQPGNGILSPENWAAKTTIAVEISRCRDRTLARIPANSGPFARLREISPILRLRGGARRTCMGPSKSSTYFTAFSTSFLHPSFFVRLGIPFLRPDPHVLDADARRGCQGRPSHCRGFKLHRFQAAS